MKRIWIAFLLTLLLSLSECSGQPASTDAPAEAGVDVTEAPASTSAPESKPVIKTTIGDFVIDSTRWVNEVNGVTPGEDEKILLVILTQPGLERLDPKEFSLEAFDKALRDVSEGEVHISGSDGSYTISTMAGWVGENFDEFAMGFRLPVTAKTGQLIWPGNEPIEILP